MEVRKRMQWRPGRRGGRGDGKGRGRGRRGGEEKQDQTSQSTLTTFARGRLIQREALSPRSTRSRPPRNQR